MSKIFISLTQLTLILSFVFFFLPKTTLAANCNFTYRPNPPNQNMKDLAVDINSNEIKSGTYRIQFIRPNGNQVDIRDIYFTTGSTTMITINPPNTGWIPGTYNLYFIEQNKIGDSQKIASCQTSFSISDIPVSSCIASIVTKPIDPNTIPVLEISGIDPGNYDIFINNESAEPYDTTKGTIVRLCKGGTKDENCKFSVGIYTVTIKSQCGIFNISCIDKPARLQCNPVSFEVAPVGSGKGGQTDTTSSGPAPTPCTGENCTKGGGDPCGDTKDNRGPAFKTAIGCVHTNPAEFVKDLMTWVLGIGGGLAFLMMLLGAFQMLTSAGNPETLAAGKDRLTSAVIGLLFVIFAILLLQIIGVGILNLPGFK